MAKKNTNGDAGASQGTSQKAEDRAVKRAQRRIDAQKTLEERAQQQQAANSANKKRPGAKETWNQLKTVYTMTHEVDKNLPWFIALGVAIPLVIAILLPLLFYRHSVAGWILTIIPGLILAASGGVYALTNRTNKMVYTAIDGRPGATSAVVGELNNKAYTFDKEPIWVDPRTKDMIWMGTSLAGVFLVGEGDYNRLQKAMDVQEKRLKNYTQGSAIPVYRICVGEGDKQVPLSKLRREITHHRKAVLRPDEREQLNKRIRSLKLRNNTMNMPKGMDPSRVKVSPRALRGK